MKRIYNYMLLAIMALATVGCADEINKDFPSAESGDEVQFGLSLPGLTRTIYGEKNGNAYPIYWVDGDKVQIISPDCLAGRNNAEYKVSVNGATQNYATSLTPTGDYGVQWGDQAAVFYSVYPSGEYTISDDGGTIKNLKINFSDDFEVIDGTVTPKQADCLMFAKTDKIDIGETVNLTYSPIATAVKFTLKGPSDNDKSVNHEHTIQYIKLIAPEDTDIAGNFDAALATSGDNAGKYVWTNWVDGGEKSNVITAQLFDKTTGEFHKIKKDEQIKMSLFLAPLEGLSITNDWKIEILVQTDSVVKDEDGNDETQAVNKTFRKSLGMKNEDETTAGTSLKPGMVHELPALPNLDVATGTEWEVGNWMENIPRNVYLSEVSLPGSWNSLNYQFQGSNPSIATQYAKGVRAFHLDTRWKAEYNLGGYGTFEKVLGLGVLDGNSGGNSWSGTITSGDKYAKSGPLFEDVLKELVGYIKTNSQEYIVLLCSFAQESFNHQSSNGYWYEEINAICGKDDYASYILDAKAISENTLVGDAIGKILVIVNMPSTITKDTKLPENSKCLFTYLPSELTNDHFNGKDDNQDKLWKSVTTTEGDSKITTTLESGINMYNNQSQITSNAESGITTDNRGYAPTLTERTAVLNKILSWSKANYSKEDYGHDMWLYLGLGGYQISDAKPTEVSNSHKNIIAATYNKWINGKILEMGTPATASSEAIPYYPVGIVLMNYTTDNSLNLNTSADPIYSTDVVKNILLLNNKYRLQYDPNKPSDYNPNAQTKSAAPSYSSGMNDSNVAAFGWD